MSTQSGPGSQSSDLLDDSELMTDDRELDADLVGKWTSLLSIFTVEFVFNNIYSNLYKYLTYKIYNSRVSYYHIYSP